MEGTKPILFYPVLGLVLIGLIMTFVINPPTAIFNTWLFDSLNSMTTSSRIVLGFVLGGMMSIDFGGPINKAAYVFGTASLMSATGQAVSSGIMASVMAGGMVPPLAIALAMLIFRNKFTPKERQSTITNFIMGLSFITEGAIPFAASTRFVSFRPAPSVLLSPARCRCSLAAPFRHLTAASSYSASSPIGPCISFL